MILHHGCSHIRTSPDQCLFAAPRSFSQLVTSFIGSQCQGILHMLFYAWTTFLSLIFIILKTVLSCLNCYVFVHFFFTVTLALFIFVWRNFNTFVTCFTNYGKTWFVSHFMFFPYLVCHVLLFGFQWASKPYLNFFRSPLSGFTTTKYHYLVFVKTGNL